MKSQLIQVNDHGIIYTAIKFCCPGCVAQRRAAGWTQYEGLHLLPVNVTDDINKPSWDVDGNCEAPTISPSICTRSTIEIEGVKQDTVCHSFLKEGVFTFLGDCTHSLVNQHIPIPDLPEWAVKIQ